MEVDPQLVIQSLLRQIAELSQRVAHLEAALNGRKSDDD